MKKVLFLFLMLVFTAGVFAQNEVVVTGVITSKEGEEPLIGVSVFEKGTNRGTITDVDGKYSIKVPVNTKLTFSYMGYFPQDMVVKKTGKIDVVLKANETLLEEVVAVGYGSIKRSDITGAVGSVSGEKLKVAPVAKIDQALQGRMAGVTVNSNSGQPGADASIRIRGIGTVNNSNPIYVVDGVITDNINFLSSSDVASLEVLKDASACAIYGSRGANGVILITTKKGDKTGKSNITFEAYAGTQNRWKDLDVMKRDEFANMKATFSNTKKELDDNGLNEWIRSNFTPNNDTFYPRIMSDTEPDGMDYTKIDTDWQDEVFVKDAMIQNYYFSIDGGNEKANYMFSTNYFDQEGTLIGSFYDRLTLRVNTSFQVRKWLKIGENLSFSNSHNRNIQGNGNTALISSAMSMAPWDPVKYPEGTYSNYTKRVPKKDMSGQYSTPSLFRNVVHPYNQVFNSHPNNNNDDWVGDVFAEITPLKGLVLRGDVSMKLWNGMNRTFTPVLNVIYNSISKNGVSASMSRSQQLTYEGTATYNTLLAKKHDITAMFGATAEKFNYYSVNASGSELVNTDERNWYVSNAPSTIRQNEDGSYYSTRSGGDDVSTKRMSSYFGRLHYVFDNKYLLTANFRVDGSSYLTPGHYWKFYPSVAGAWKINEEEFFKSLSSSVDFLKLRVAWGRLGNERSLSATSAVENVWTGTSWMVGYPYGNPNALSAGLSMGSYPPVIEWEYTEQADLGLDFGLFNGLLHGTVDIFQRTTNGMHMTIQPPAHVGFRYAPTGNAATVRNQGIEFSLEHKNKIGGFYYSVGGNISFINNELTKLNGGEPLWNDFILSTEGYALNTIWARVYDGVFQSQEEVDAHVTMVDNGSGQKVPKVIQPNAKPGDARYLDLNGDGQITDLDRTDVGNPFPTTTYGFNITAEYKGFDLQMFFQGVAGNEIYNGLRQKKLEFDGSESVLSTDMRNVYFPGQDANNPSHLINIIPGSNGSIPNPLGSTDNKLPSSRFVEDASYLRLKNMQIGYTIPKSLTGKIGVERLRFYVGGSNLLTFTKYKGFDPEVGDNGRDYGNFPQARTLLLGLNMNF